MTMGPAYLAKLVCVCMATGSAFLLLQHALNGSSRPFMGNDSIIHGMIFTMAIANPGASFMLFPLPISIPAWLIAVMIVGLDLL